MHLIRKFLRSSGWNERRILPDQDTGCLRSHLRTPFGVANGDTALAKRSPLDGPERQYAVEMIKRMAVGDEAAMAAFYQRFAPTLYGLALKMMKDEKEA